ncbi:cobalamin (vitamin B12) biosynthesis CbiM protein [Methanococcus vannielii SB]|jgi:cobalt/nickel transport system permease protein|uniref:Cobalamin (Vitamin B12) biosynthesis CbiM protein n=1 Tax=Methanococcus vannielii (strain ATCC 35089 / DSM 1224 / JCM 13029 / OCM 148 / SB) TaxID=406327 RepID=A6UN74_METVS|nr:cobalt transporter CbiM [Methanococcus vannielii]ABR53946.1 cobalamin (vitamin B12) biosynthesis CbiM protein [Methanococcus vannielii SB]
MHIPDGFLPLWLSAVFWVISIIFVSFSLKWASKEMNEKTVPMFSALAAGIFAIQAMNMPIPWGTSGHMIGAALTAIVFNSPWAGVLMLALVLIVQGLFFADGGLIVMGANIFNMGVIGGFLGYYVFKALKKVNFHLSVFLSGWAATFFAAVFCTIQLAISGTFPIDLGLQFMGIYHAVIGIIEGIITLVVISYVSSVRPDLLKVSKKVITHE